MRGARGDCTTQEPSRLVRITRLFFEIPILSLRRRRLERKSTKKHSEIDKILGAWPPNRPKNPSRAVLGAQSGFGDASGRVRDDFWTPKCCPRADLGSLRTIQERSRAVQKHAGASQTRSKFLRDSFQDAPKVVRVAKRSRKRSRIDFGMIFGQCAEAPKCISYWFLQCFFDVGCFARRMFVERTNVEQNCCSGLENRGRGRPREARANKFGRQNGQVGQKSALEVPPGPPKIYKWARTKQLRARKSAPQAAKARRGPKHPKRFSVISRWMVVRLAGDDFFG